MEVNWGNRHRRYNIELTCVINGFIIQKMKRKSSIHKLFNFSNNLYRLSIQGIISLDRQCFGSFICAQTMLSNCSEDFLTL